MKIWFNRHLCHKELSLEAIKYGSIFWSLCKCKETLENHIRRLTQLYEQKKRLPNWQAFLDEYRQHWVTWVYSGIPSSIINFDYESVELRLFLKST
jgi:hypothetical protein